MSRNIWGGASLDALELWLRESRSDGVERRSLSASESRGVGFVVVGSVVVGAGVGLIAVSIHNNKFKYREANNHNI